MDEIDELEEGERKETNNERLGLAVAKLEKSMTGLLEARTTPKGLTDSMYQAECEMQSPPRKRYDHMYDGLLHVLLTWQQI